MQNWFMYIYVCVCVRAYGVFVIRKCLIILDNGTRWTIEWDIYGDCNIVSFWLLFILVGICRLVMGCMCKLWSGSTYALSDTVRWLHVFSFQQRLLDVSTAQPPPPLLLLLLFSSSSFSSLLFLLLFLLTPASSPLFSPPILPSSPPLLPSCPILLPCSPSPASPPHLFPFSLSFYPPSSSPSSSCILTPPIFEPMTICGLSVHSYLRVTAGSEL
jgi:hypothetical protein